ncbi:MAG TPA: vitamin K epoxide reductase family protein [Vicinamibacteria bacterium]|nr:vitamin K epoxide reductase family protein [Vicinamibacteria bacterium]
MSTPPIDLDAAPAPWDYNPSAWDQRIPICVLAMVGFGIAFYMGMFQWGLVKSVWDPVFGEQTKKVLTSNVSHQMYAWFRVPDAAFGALAYLGDAIFGLAGSTRRWQYRPWMVVIFGIDVIPLGIVSAILVVLQGTVVGNWCFLCLVTAVISLILVVLAYDEVWSCLLFLWRVWKRTRSARVLWSAFCGQPSEEAAAVALSRRAGHRVG